MAKRLAKKSALTKPDPYIKAMYNGNYQRSTTLKSTCDPKFEHDFELYVLPLFSSFYIDRLSFSWYLLVSLNVDKVDIIYLQVYDDCQLSKDDFLYVPLKKYFFFI